MYKIAIIDDHANARKTLGKAINLSLRSMKLDGKWVAEDHAPLQEIDAYPQWIKDNDVAVLIVDERLSDIPLKGGRAVSYLGHDLVKSIREIDKELPVFILTTYPKDTGLIKHEADYEDIIERKNFRSKRDVYVKRFIRSSQRYLQTHEDEYLELSRLSEKLALGVISPKDLERLKSIQEKLSIPYQTRAYKTRGQWLSEFETELSELEALQRRISQMLNKNSDEVEEDNKG